MTYFWASGVLVFFLKMLEFYHLKFIKFYVHILIPLLLVLGTAQQQHMFYQREEKHHTL